LLLLPPPSSSFLPLSIYLSIYLSTYLFSLSFSFYLEVSTCLVFKALQPHNRRAVVRNGNLDNDLLKTIDNLGERRPDLQDMHDNSTNGRPLLRNAVCVP